MSKLRRQKKLRGFQPLPKATCVCEQLQPGETCLLHGVTLQEVLSMEEFHKQFPGAAFCHSTKEAQQALEQQ